MLQHDAGSAATGDHIRLPAQRPPSRRAGVSRWLARLSPDDRAALGIWAAAHAALLVLAWAAAWAFRSTLAHAPLTGGFERWDAVLLRNIAQYGYFGPHTIPNNAAFFPGYPMALSAAHLLLRNWVLSELAVSAVAGCFAVVSLARLAGHSRAVVYLVTAPAAIFLMVGYSEALFLAFAVPAWRAATSGRWWRASLLAGLAGLVRPDALFLIPALALMALVREQGRRRLARAAIACAALVGPAAYELYLRTQTGSWMTWSRALRTGWDLHLSTPAQALRTTWWAAFRHAFSASTAFEFQVELGAMAVMVIATVAFACWRQWPEAAYCGVAVIAFGTSTWYSTCPRTLLVLFPIWVGLARLAARRPWVTGAYLAISGPVAVVLGMLYLSGQWAG
jgi:Mannosyltransferase (PIG-V)